MAFGALIDFKPVEAAEFGSFEAQSFEDNSILALFITSAIFIKVTPI